MSYSDSDSPLSSPPESADEAPAPKTRHIDVNRTKRQVNADAATTSTSKKAAAPKKKKKPTPAPPAPTKIKLKAPAPPPRSPSPPPKKRKKEPPHVYTLADSPELAFIVMFRSRFADAFKGVPNLGCQDIERGIVDSTPSEQVEQLLCRIISLVLNRKKPVERGHHNRALEEAVHAHQAQWPRQWQGKNPMPGGKGFGDLDTTGRITALKALINWALTSSEQIRTIIAENYKGSRRDDDLNVAISVQPWGRDGEKRKYWLIEGRDDTPFRLYREKNAGSMDRTWINIAGTIDEMRQVAHELEEDDGTKHAMALKTKIDSAILRFEEGEKKRQKREYRATRKAMFSQPNGASLYEGRTRGKRIRYNFSDADDDKDSEETRSGRSTRNTPLPEAPRFTASGRQIRKPQTGLYGEVKINGSRGTSAGSETEAPPPFSYAEDQWDGDSQGDDDDENEDEVNADDENEDDDENANLDSASEPESEWDDTAFVPLGDEKRSLKIILKVNNKGRLSRASSMAREAASHHDRVTRASSAAR
ncbi:hypothetical protein BZA05DRAFT_350503, partial [Tricharina praecox]|uniref:uncharacterized protein n=1 Tax=Tricharina praecox TaxID=43433 RepID=UPI00221FFAA4